LRELVLSPASAMGQVQTKLEEGFEDGADFITELESDNGVKSLEAGPQGSWVEKDRDPMSMKRKEVNTREGRRPE